MYTLYKHTTPSNKVYIGITSQTVERRWRKGVGYAKNIHFRRAIELYGWDNIRHEILAEGLCENEAKEKEKQLIKEYNSTDPKYGYNITKGGDTRVVTEETRLKMAIANKGKKRTPEQIQRYKLAASKRVKPKFLSEEHKKKISESLKGNTRAKGHREHAIPVIQLTLDGEYVNYFKYGANDAAKVVGCCKSGINCACRENLSEDVSKTKYKGRYKGYIWRYYDDATKHMVPNFS